MSWSLVQIAKKPVSVGELAFSCQRKVRSYPGGSEQCSLGLLGSIGCTDSWKDSIVGLTPDMQKAPLLGAFARCAPMIPEKRGDVKILRAQKGGTR